MRGRALGLFLALALAASAHAQPYAVGKQDLAATGGGGFSTPSGCVATSVPIFLGSPVALGCDAGLTYDAATDTLTAGGFKIVAGAGIGKVLVSDVNGVGSWGAAGAAGAGGADTQVNFNDGGVLAGDAGLTFNKTTNALSSTGPFTLTPLADVVPMTVRAYSSGTSHIAQFQDSSNGALSHISHTGAFVGNVTGNVSGTAGSATGNAANVTGIVAVANGGTGADLSAVAKGGVISGTGAGTVGVTTVGTDGQVLSADAASAGGVKWVAAGAGGGITNSAGANVVTKSDGTNVVASSITDDGTTLKLGNTGNAVVEATGAITLTAQAVGTTPLSIVTAGSATVPALILKDGASAATQAWLLDIRNSSNTTVAGFSNSKDGNGPGWLFTKVISASGPTFAWPYIDMRTASTIKMGTGAANSWTLTDTKSAFGVAAASPVAYTHSLAADGTGSNIRGAKATLTPGNGTGSGGGGSYALQTALPVIGGTATAANVLGTRHYVSSVPKALTLGSNTDFVTVAFPASSGISVKIAYSVVVTDAGGEFKVHGGFYHVSALRKSTGNAVASTVVETGETNVISTGNAMTDAMTATVSATGFSLGVNVNEGTGLTTPTGQVTWQIFIDGTGAATVTEL